MDHQTTRTNQTLNTRPFLDTQILIGAIQGRNLDRIPHASINSVAASEFLGALTDDPSRAKFYIPFWGERHALMLEAGRLLHHNRPMPKHSTDHVLMDFNGQHPTVIQFSNLALAEAINNRTPPSAFYSAISHMPKSRRKATKRKFEFLIDNQIDCVPLSRTAIELAHDLLKSYSTKHALKENFRNSWNDLLIAATALDESRPLLTDDEPLAKHIATVTQAEIRKSSDIVELSPPQGEPKRNINRESKGYINRGWQIRFSKQYK